VVDMTYSPAEQRLHRQRALDLAAIIESIES
jgi:hypothetical protein